MTLPLKPAAGRATTKIAIQTLSATSCWPSSNYCKCLPKPHNLAMFSNISLEAVINYID